MLSFVTIAKKCVFADNLNEKDYKHLHVLGGLDKTVPIGPPHRALADGRQVVCRYTMDETDGKYWINEYLSTLS